MSGPVLVTHAGNAPDDTGGIASVIRLLTTYPIDGVRAASIPTYDSAGSVRTLIRFLRALVRIATARRADLGVLHVHLSKGGSFVREGALLVVGAWRGRPVVATVHGSSFVAWSGRHPRLTRAVLTRADRVTVLSNGARDHLAALGVTPVDRVPNGVRVPAASRSRAEAPTVVFAGEISTRKGVDVLLDAWPGVTAHLPDAQLHLIGPPADLARPADQAGLRHLGPRSPEEVLDELGRAWVAVLPSRAEGLPMFLLEAMAAGCGIVATGVGGIPELVASGADVGELVAVADAAALADALVRALDPVTATVRGSAARSLVEQRYSAAVVTGQLREIWRAAAGRS